MLASRRTPIRTSWSGLGVEAPDPARREERAYREYVGDEQRRRAGCIGSQTGQVILIGVLSLVLMSAAATAAMPCEQLDALSTPQVGIRATSTPAGPFVAPGAATAAPASSAAAGGRGGAGTPQAPPLPAHCRVRL